MTLAAARAYAAVTGLGIEAARLAVTVALLDAHRVAAPEGGPERWRYRSRSAGLDLGAHVSRERRLAVVVHLRVRRSARSRR